MESSYCFGCKKTLPNDQFYQSNLTVCRECQKKRAKASRQTEKGRETVRRLGKIRYQKDRVKCLARAKVKQAVSKGSIIKPGSCERCGQVEPLHAHHEDYSKPLEVNWLCRICHLHKHGKIVDLSLVRSEV